MMYPASCEARNEIAYAISSGVAALWSGICPSIDLTLSSPNTFNMSVSTAPGATTFTVIDLDATH